MLSLLIPKYSGPHDQSPAQWTGQSCVLQFAHSLGGGHVPLFFFARVSTKEKYFRPPPHDFGVVSVSDTWHADDLVLKNILANCDHLSLACGQLRPGNPICSCAAVVDHLRRCSPTCVRISICFWSWNGWNHWHILWSNARWNRHACMLRFTHSSNTFTLNTSTAFTTHKNGNLLLKQNAGI